MTNKNIKPSVLKGSINLGFFGALWMVYPAFNFANGLQYVAISVIAINIIIIIFSIIKLRRLPSASNVKQSEEDLNTFYKVVRYQWIAILLSGVVLSLLQLQQFTAFTVMIIVGLHFWPLAKVFKQKVYYLTTILIILSGTLGIIFSGDKTEQVSYVPFVATSIILLLTVLYLLITTYGRNNKH